MADPPAGGMIGDAVRSRVAMSSSPRIAVLTSSPGLLAQILEVLDRADLPSRVVMGPPADEGTTIPDSCDVILLDLDIDAAPGDLVASVRSRSECVLIAISSRTDEATKVEALNAGANDYISTPFGTSEFLARVQAARRVRRRPPPAPRIGESEGREVSLGGRKIKLTRIEWRLLSILAAQPGRIVPHSELLREVWGPLAEQRVHYLRVYMNKLRRKIEPDPDRPVYLLSVPKSGYLFRNY